MGNDRPVGLNLIGAITDFFQNPRWLNNLLWGALCVLVPIVGPLVMMGWLAEVFFSPRARSGPGDFANFDVNRLGTYLERGVWPFLVQIAASLVMVPVVWMLMLVPMLVLLPFAHGGDSSAHPGALGVMVMGFAYLAMAVVYVSVFVVMMLFMRPLTIRAILTQDFIPAFDFRFAMQFVGNTWLQLVVGTLFLTVAASVMAALGVMALCVGVYAASAVAFFAMIHLDRQYYDIHLARGGDAVPVSPKWSSGGI